MEINSKETTIEKSSSIEHSISIFSEMLKNNECDLDEIKNLIIKNELPYELRPIIWKIFLGILPRDKKTYEWIQITKNLRSEFGILCNKEEINMFTKVIKKELDVNHLGKLSLQEEYYSIKQELEKLSHSNIFFKTQYISETMLRLYFIWRRGNLNNSNDDYFQTNFQPFYILAVIVYSLYPSILHFNLENKDLQNQEDLDAKTLLYFLNLDESFESDAFWIFDKLMNMKKFYFSINSFGKLNRQEWDFIKASIVDVKEFIPISSDIKMLISNFNRYEKISYFYLKLINENLLNHLFSIQLDPYDIIGIWYISLLTASICLEHITYFWDNIFGFSDIDGNSFDFLDFILLSLIDNLSEVLMTGDIITNKLILMRYPEHRLDSKEIINMAFKFKEKISKIFH